jgi:hypothetical protein
MSRRSALGGSAVIASAVAGLLFGLHLRANRVKTLAGDVRENRPAGTDIDGTPAVRSSVPRFSVPAGDVQSAGPITDPRDKRYSAADLVGGNRAGVEVFAREPRDPVWAREMEQAMVRMVEGDLKALVPGATDLAVECRTQTCRIEVQAQNPDDAGKIVFALQIGSLGKAVDFTNRRKLAKGVVEAYAMSDQASRGVRKWQEFNRVKRKAFLDTLRGMPPDKVPVWVPVSINNLPKE